MCLDYFRFSSFLLDPLNPVRPWLALGALAGPLGFRRRDRVEDLINPRFVVDERVVGVRPDPDVAGCRLVDLGLSWPWGVGLVAQR